MVSSVVPPRRAKEDFWLLRRVQRLRMAGHPLVMFYAYILQSVDHPAQFYRGHTSDLKQRVAEHNAGRCPHTSKFAPWKVRFYAAFERIELAQHFESYLKTGSGHEFARRHFL